MGCFSKSDGVISDALRLRGGLREGGGTNCEGRETEVWDGGGGLTVAAAVGEVGRLDCG